MDKPDANIGGEDEESRLRRKLLERRSAQPSSSSGNSGSRVIKLKRSPPSAVARDGPSSEVKHQMRGERKPIRWKSPSEEEGSPSRGADSKSSSTEGRSGHQHTHKRSHDTQHRSRQEFREDKTSDYKNEKPAPTIKNTVGVDQGEYSVEVDDHSPSPPHVTTTGGVVAKSLPNERQARSPIDHQMSTPESIGGGEVESEEKLKKRSKFESTSEEEDEGMDSGDDGSGGNAGEPILSPYNSDEDTADVSEKGKVAVGLTNKRYEQLTSEEKALLSPETLKRMEDDYQKRLIARLPVYYPGISGCRSVAEFECLNRIEEGTFGVVYRAVEKRTDEVVALKRLKMEKEKDGFPITSLREINMLLKCGKHKNIVNVREIVIGSNMDKIYLVMEYIEHDIKSLMEVMKNKGKKFTLPQVKTLMKQLLSGVEHMHEEYVIHRDLKSSNLLLSHNGVLKIADFGLAREYGDPLKPYTPVVVTLWYRSPELLLGVKEYSTAVDMWSVGCIFGEFLKLKPMFRGEGEIDQLNKIFMEIGTPNETIWPGYNDLPGVKKFAFANAPYNQLKKKFVSELPTEAGAEFLNRLLAPCPARRMSASAALASGWFEEEPKPIPPELFPTYPAKSEHNKKPAPIRPTLTHPVAVEPVQSAERLKLLSELKVDARLASKGGFALKFDAPKFPK